jgi:uncharacterized membrane protein
MSELSDPGSIREDDSTELRSQLRRMEQHMQGIKAALWVVAILCLALFFTILGLIFKVSLFVFVAGWVILFAIFSALWLLLWVTGNAPRRRR